MRNIKLIFCLIWCAIWLRADVASGETIEEEEIRAEAFLKALNGELNHRRAVLTEAEWKFATNITDYNQEVKDTLAAEHAEFTKEKTKEILAFHFKDFKNEALKRHFEKLSKLGYAALSQEKFKELTAAITAMESNYAKAKICSYQDPTKCDLQLEPELTEILLKSEDPQELQYYWTQWYNTAGTPTRSHFETYLKLNKEAALLNNFTSGAEAWLYEYEDETIERQLEDIFDQIRPFYKQIHAYVRHALHKKFGDLVSPTGSIPMHLLGNMWAQTWDSVYKYTAPYPSKQSPDVTDEMKRQNYTALKMFKLSESFFTSLNMTELPESFWENSVIVKPDDGRELICHASAWDFFNGTDVRIKQCTRVTMDDQFTVLHEMGHIYYFLQYAQQPYIFRDGANPGFHEAIGDTFALSAATPHYLESVGLLKDYKHDEETKINELYEKAMQKIVFLPFAYSLDQYRWALFRGQVPQDEYNCRFWQMRQEASGITPPIQRYKEDFDPPAKYHISGDVEYLRYVISFILQFQFHKGACVLAGQYDPKNATSVLSDCDIYGSTDAGNAIKKMLSLGSAKPWPEALEIVTGQRKMEASALLEYFKPLQDWLEKKNQETGAHVGWESDYKCLSRPN